MITKPAYDEVLNFLANGMSSEELIKFRASEETNLRVEFLIRKEKNDTLSDDERNELDKVMQFNHLVTLAKAKARARLSTA